MKPADEVIDHLRSNSYEKYLVSPLNLEIVEEGNLLFLDVKENGVNRFPIRTSFIKKLLMWYKMPYSIKDNLSKELFLEVINQLLHGINSRDVFVNIENKEALTITSTFFAEFSNLVLYEKLKNLDITAISHDDYLTQFFTNKKAEANIFSNDEYGFGYDVTNSETGFSALSLEHYVLRYICRNGALVPVKIKDERKNHYKITNYELTEFINKRIDSATHSRNTFINLLKKSSQVDSRDYRYFIVRKLNYVLGSWQGDDFMKEFDWNGSKYDVFNYITHKAKSFDVNKRYRLERMASEIILN